jgi:hypothetical protein
MPDDIAPDDLEQIRDAKRKLEHPGLAVRIAGVVGGPLEAGIKRLPDRARRAVDTASHRALEAGLEFAVATMDTRAAAPPDNRFHKVAVTAVGAGGGALGLLALPLELPVSTVLMLRSIADVARAHGEDVTHLESRLACLEVFALGGRASSDDAADAGYFAVRAALATAVSDAARHIASKGLSEKAAPALVRLIALVAKRFGVAVAQKVAVQLVPVLGAAGGAAVNLLFMDHYQSVAEAHFAIRRLERKYPPALVRAAYDALPK